MLYVCFVHSVLETSTFTRRSDALLSVEEKAEMVDALAANPQAGAVIPGLGGIRKVRFAPKGGGKPGAFRVIYYVVTENLPILALLIYSKNEQVNPTPAQRTAMLRAVEALRPKE